MSTVRLRRLQSDYERLREFVRRQPRVRLIQAEGDPPERYQLEYQIKGLRQVDDQLQTVTSHMVEIALPRSYPRMPPQCRMLTPIFHPNIAPHAICIGDHWSAGEPLWSMVARIGEMIAYQSYNTKSPLNGEAARWVDQNEEKLPLDPINMCVDQPSAAPAAVRSAPAPSRSMPPPLPPVGLAPAARPAVPHAAPAVPPSTAAAPPLSAPLPSSAEAIMVACPGCNTRYRVPAQGGARRLRCKRCQSIINIPAQPAGR